MICKVCYGGKGSSDYSLKDGICKICNGTGEITAHNCINNEKAAGDFLDLFIGKKSLQTIKEGAVKYHVALSNLAKK